MWLTVLPVVVEVGTLLLTLAGLVYLSMALVAVRLFGRQAVPVLRGAAPTVSVLKPVRGSDPELYRSFASHCAQVYPGRWELLLGAAGREEEAALETMAGALRAEFPAVPVRVLLCDKRLGTSGKVSTLLQMVPQALGDVLVINDADIRVGPGYLAAVAAWLGEPGVGLVTVPYLGEAVDGGFWARLEALGIATEFLPGVLASRMLEGGLRFGLGSTLALRRETLEAVGGLTPLLEQLADDYELGVQVAASGRRVVLAREVVATSVPRYDFRGFVEHQLRWSRTVRSVRPWQYVGIVTTLALPWALATVVSSGGALWSVSLLSLALLLRVAVALSVGVGVLGDGQVLRDVWMLPVRDCVSLLLWVWSYAGDEVVWRGERFRARGGRMERV